MGPVPCQTCGGLKSPTTDHACRVQLHPQVANYLGSARARELANPGTAEQALTLWALEALWALDPDDVLDQYLEAR